MHAVQDGMAGGIEAARVPLLGGCKRVAKGERRGPVGGLGMDGAVEDELGMIHLRQADPARREVAAQGVLHPAAAQVLA